MAPRRMESNGYRPGSKVLFVDENRSEAVGGRSRELGAIDGGGGTHPSNRAVGVEVMRWYRRFVQRELTERRLDAELRFHLDQKIADLVAAGVAPEGPLPRAARIWRARSSERRMS